MPARPHGRGLGHENQWHIFPWVDWLRGQVGTRNSLTVTRISVRVFAYIDSSVRKNSGVLMQGGYPCLADTLRLHQTSKTRLGSHWPATWGFLGMGSNSSLEVFCGSLVCCYVL